MLDLVAMYECLRATRDADSCLRGLNEFRKGLRGDGGPSFLASYLRLSPEWQELQAVWDAQLTVSAAAAAACRQHQCWCRVLRACS